MKGKARLVAKGYSQQAGVDSFEICAPTPSATSVRVVAFITCESGLGL